MVNDKEKGKWYLTENLETKDLRTPYWTDNMGDFKTIMMQVENVTIGLDKEGALVMFDKKLAEALKRGKGKELMALREIKQ